MDGGQAEHSPSSLQPGCPPRGALGAAPAPVPHTWLAWKS